MKKILQSFLASQELKKCHLSFGLKWVVMGRESTVRGVLGNKCAGQHNLKTVYFGEKLASGNFLVWLSGVCVFLQRSIYPMTAAASFYVMMVGASPYKLFLRVPWVNTQLASSDFTFRKRKKVAGVKYSEKWSWENI
jgi:hypothetical protein